MNIMFDIAVCGTLYYMSERDTFGCGRWCHLRHMLYLRTQIFGGCSYSKHSCLLVVTSASDGSGLLVIEAG